MIWISCHVVGPMQTSAREVELRNLPPYTHNDDETRVPEIDPRRRSVSVKTQKRCRRIRTGPNHTALKTRLQTERVSAEKQPQHLPPKKRPTVLIRRAPRVLLFAAARSEGAP